MTEASHIDRNLFLPQLPSNTLTFATPGITSESRDAVAELLKKAHIKYHCFFNEKGFHTHLAHGVLAAYALGATPQRLREIYDSHASEQRPIGDIKKQFTVSDWKSQLGDSSYYASYLQFFRNEVIKLGRVKAITKYMFDHDFIVRAFSGAFHPLIHVGYGLEFGTDGIVAEGLAMAAVTSTLMAPFVVRPANPLEKVTNTVADQLAISKSDSPGKTIVEILQAIREDHDLDDVTQYALGNKTNEVAKNKKVASKLNQYLAEWHVSENLEDIDTKSKELVISCVQAVGGTGLRNKQVKQDFFLMHALTSVIFTYKYAHTLEPAHAVSVLKSHLAVSLVYYISRGRPPIDLEALKNYNGNEKLDSTNAWFTVLKRAVDINEVHATKVARSCAFADLLFGGEDGYDRMCRNTAQIALDLDGDWEFEGVGYDETWEF